MDYRVSEQKTKVTKKSYSILMWDSVVIGIYVRVVRVSCVCFLRILRKLYGNNT